MFIAYRSCDGKLYASLVESVRNENTVERQYLDNLGRVLDREKGIYRNRERGGVSLMTSIRIPMAQFLRITRSLQNGSRQNICQWPGRNGRGSALISGTRSSWIVF